MYVCNACNVCMVWYGMVWYGMDVCMYVCMYVFMYGYLYAYNRCCILTASKWVGLKMGTPNIWWFVIMFPIMWPFWKYTTCSDKPKSLKKTNPFAGTALPETSHTTPNQYNWGKPTNLVRNGRTLRIGVSLKIGLKLGCYKVANPKS